MNLNLIEPLTQRETEMLWLLDAQLSTREIAAVLRISPRTVKRHTSSIDRKLVLRTRRTDVARAHGLRLRELDADLAAAVAAGSHDDWATMLQAVRLIQRQAMVMRELLGQTRSEPG